MRQFDQDGKAKDHLCLQDEYSGRATLDQWLEMQADSQTHDKEQRDGLLRQFD
jgi:hypothetical protein